jgi:hypothetical protein
MKYLKRFNESILDDVRSEVDKTRSNIDTKLGRKFCTKCGAKIDTKFCKECGTEVSGNQQDVESTLELPHLQIPKIVIDESHPHQFVQLKDGGTLTIFTNKGKFSIDKRIGTETPYKVSLRDLESRSSSLPLYTQVKGLINALKEYSTKNKQEEWLKSYIDGITKTLEDYSYPVTK